MRLGIDLGGTNIAAGVVDDKGKILLKQIAPTPVKEGADSIVATMGTLCLGLLKKAGLALEQITLCGIAAPGVANRKTGIVEVSANLPFVYYPVVQTLQNYLPGVKILLENDANAAAKGEVEVGAAKGAENAIMITLGTGVGGGIIIRRQVYSGFNFAGGELGHVVIVYDGEPCGCGRKGCWEAYSSATALVRITKEKMNAFPDSIMNKMVQIEGRVNGRTAFNAAKKGDHAGKEAVEEYIRYLACGLTNIINIFQPEILIIGGGICGEGEYLLKPLEEIINQEQYTRIAHVKTKLVIATLGNDAGIIGASLIDR